MTEIVDILLQRNDIHVPWGFDTRPRNSVNETLIVARVQPNTVASHNIKLGDVILKVGDYKTTTINDQQLQKLINAQEKTLQIILYRDNRLVNQKSSSYGRSISLPREREEYHPNPPWLKRGSGNFDCTKPVTKTFSFQNLHTTERNSSQRIKKFYETIGNQSDDSGSRSSSVCRQDRQDKRTNVDRKGFKVSPSPSNTTKVVCKEAVQKSQPELLKPVAAPLQPTNANLITPTKIIPQKELPPLEDLSGILGVAPSSRDDSTKVDIRGYVGTQNCRGSSRPISRRDGVISTCELTPFRDLEMSSVVDETESIISINLSTVSGGNVFYAGRNTNVMGSTANDLCSQWVRNSYPSKIQTKSDIYEDHVTKMKMKSGFEQFLTAHSKEYDYEVMSTYSTDTQRETPRDLPPDNTRDNPSENLRENPRETSHHANFHQCPLLENATINSRDIKMGVYVDNINKANNEDIRKDPKSISEPLNNLNSINVNKQPERLQTNVNFQNTKSFFDQKIDGKEEGDSRSKNKTFNANVRRESLNITRKEFEAPVTISVENPTQATPSQPKVGDEESAGKRTPSRKFSFNANVQRKSFSEAEQNRFKEYLMESDLEETDQKHCMIPQKPPDTLDLTQFKITEHFVELKENVQEFYKPSGDKIADKIDDLGSESDEAFESKSKIFPGFKHYQKTQKKSKPPQKNYQCFYNELVREDCSTERVNQTEIKEKLNRGTEERSGVYVNQNINSTGIVNKSIINFPNSSNPSVLESKIVGETQQSIKNYSMDSYQLNQSQSATVNHLNKENQDAYESLNMAGNYSNQKNTKLIGNSENTIPQFENPSNFYNSEGKIANFKNKSVWNSSIDSNLSSEREFFTTNYQNKPIQSVQSPSFSNESHSTTLDEQLYSNQNCSSISNNQTVTNYSNQEKQTTTEIDINQNQFENSSGSFVNFRNQSNNSYNSSSLYTAVPAQTFYSPVNFHNMKSPSHESSINDVNDKMAKLHSKFNENVDQELKDTLKKRLIRPSICVKLDTLRNKLDNLEKSENFAKDKSEVKTSSGKSRRNSHILQFANQFESVDEIVHIPYKRKSSGCVLEKNVEEMCDLDTIQEESKIEQKMIECCNENSEKLIDQNNERTCSQACKLRDEKIDVEKSPENLEKSEILVQRMKTVNLNDKTYHNYLEDYLDQMNDAKSIVEPNKSETTNEIYHSPERPIQITEVKIHSNLRRNSNHDQIFVNFDDQDEFYDCSEYVDVEFGQQSLTKKYQDIDDEIKSQVSCAEILEDILDLTQPNDGKKSEKSDSLNENERMEGLTVEMKHNEHNDNYPTFNNENIPCHEIILDDAENDFSHKNVNNFHSFCVVSNVEYNKANNSGLYSSNTSANEELGSQNSQTNSISDVVTPHTSQNEMENVKNEIKPDRKPWVPSAMNAQTDRLESNFYGNKGGDKPENDQKSLGNTEESMYRPTSENDSKCLIYNVEQGQILRNDNSFNFDSTPKYPTQSPSSIETNSQNLTTSVIENQPNSVPEYAKRPDTLFSKSELPNLGLSNNSDSSTSAEYMSPVSPPLWNPRLSQLLSNPQLEMNITIEYSSPDDFSDPSTHPLPPIPVAVSSVQTKEKYHEESQSMVNGSCQSLDNARLEQQRMVGANWLDGQEERILFERESVGYKNMGNQQPNSISNSNGGYYPPPPPPHLPDNNSLGRRLPAEIPARLPEPPACIQNAMATKDKKPFTYTPGGIDLSQIKSPRMARRLTRNAMAEGVSEAPQRPVQQQPMAKLPPAALAAMQPQIQIQVLPTGGLQNSNKTSNSAPPPPPPPLPVNMGGAPENKPIMQNQPPAPPKQPPPTQYARPDIKIPSNPTAMLRHTEGPFRSKFEEAAFDDTTSNRSFDDKPQLPPLYMPPREQPVVYRKPSESPNQIGSEIKLKSPPQPPTKSPSSIASGSPQSPMVNLNKAPTPWLTKSQQPQQSLPPWAHREDEAKLQSATQSPKPNFDNQNNYEQQFTPQPQRAPAPTSSVPQNGLNSPNLNVLDQQKLAPNEKIIPIQMERDTSQEQARIDEQRRQQVDKQRREFHQQQQQQYAQQQRQYEQQQRQYEQQQRQYEQQQRQHEQQSHYEQMQQLEQQRQVEQTKRLYEQQMREMQQKSGGVPQMTGTRIIPIQIEGASNLEQHNINKQMKQMTMNNNTESFNNNRAPPTPTRQFQSPTGYSMGANGTNGSNRSYQISPSEQKLQEPRYTGSSIPSRSFRVLQAITTPNDPCATNESTDEYRDTNSDCLETQNNPSCYDPYWSQPYWGYYQYPPYYMYPYPHPSPVPNKSRPSSFILDDGNEKNNENGDSDGSNQNNQNQMYSMPYWDPYYGYYSYGPPEYYPGNYMPPLPQLDVDSDNNYSSNDEMTYYGKKFRDNSKNCPEIKVEDNAESDSDSTNANKLMSKKSFSNLKDYTDDEKDYGRNPAEKNDQNSDESDDGDENDDDENDTETIHSFTDEIPHQLSVIFEDIESDSSVSKKIDCKNANNSDDDSSSTTITADNSDDESPIKPITFQLPLQFKFTNADNQTNATVVVGEIQNDQSKESLNNMTNLTTIKSEIDRSGSNASCDTNVSFTLSVKSRNARSTSKDDVSTNSNYSNYETCESDSEVSVSVSLPLPRKSNEEIRLVASDEDNSSSSSCSSDESDSDDDDSDDAKSESDSDSDHSEVKVELTNEKKSIELSDSMEIVKENVRKSVNLIKESTKVPSAQERLEMVRARRSTTPLSVRERINAFEDSKESNDSKTRRITESDVDSGVTSDMSASKNISETDTDPESKNHVGERSRKINKYQRASTHSRLYKLLQFECENEDDDDDGVDGDDNCEGDLKIEDARLEHETNRKSNLSLPLTQTETSSMSSSSLNSPSSPNTKELLVQELIQSLLKRKKAKCLRNVSMAKLHAAALRILQQDMDTGDTTVSSSLEDGKGTSSSTPIQTPKEFYTDDYNSYYRTWAINGEDGFVDDKCDDSSDDVIPSKAFKLLQEHCRDRRGLFQRMLNNGTLQGVSVRCPRVASENSLKVACKNDRDDN